MRGERAPLIAQMQAYSTERGQSEVFRVGIGTLCRRADSMTIRAIVAAIREALPKGESNFTCGVRLAAIRTLDLPNIEGNVGITDTARGSS